MKNSKYSHRLIYFDSGYGPIGGRHAYLDYSILLLLLLLTKKFSILNSLFTNNPSRKKYYCSRQIFGTKSFFLILFYSFKGEKSVGRDHKMKDAVWTDLKEKFAQFS